MPAPPKILVTGASGFVGRRAVSAWPGAVALPQLDLRLRETVRPALEAVMTAGPLDSVVHLAALSSVRCSFSDPPLYYAVNVIGTVHLLEALADLGWKGRFLFVSTGAVYGDLDQLSSPLTEQSPLAPASPYAASKAAAEAAVLEWGRRQGSTAMVARPYNHTGPGQTADYFLPSMARQLTRAARGEQVVIEAGNLAPYRDFLHVDDVVEAYLAMLCHGRAGTVYNVARGVSQPLAELLDGLIAASGRQAEVRVAAARYREETPRPVEICNAALRHDTGWEPRRGLEQLYSDLIDFWESQSYE